MPRHEFITIACIAVALLAFGVWRVWDRLYKRRLRKQMVRDGRLPALTAWTWKRIVQSVLSIIGSVAVLILWLATQYASIVATPHILHRTGNLLGFVICIVGIVVLMTILWRRGPGSLANRALRLARHGQPDLAIELLRNAPGEPPSAQRAGALGQIFFDQKRWSDAADAFREAMHLDVKQPIHLVHLAKSLASDRRADEALVLIEERRLVSPEESAYAYAAAWVLAELGKNLEASEQLRQAMELDSVTRSQQLLDGWTHAKLRQECVKRLDENSIRGFPVVAAQTGEVRAE